jgi:hypothetical protein
LKHLLAHNEDASPSVYDTAYIVRLKIHSKDYNGKMSPNEDLTCYCYPAHLPGNAFGFNATGFVFGVNALYPRYIEPTRMRKRTVLACVLFISWRLTCTFVCCLFEQQARQFMNRVMMSASSLIDLENMFLNLPMSYGVR